MQIDPPKIINFQLKNTIKLITPESNLYSKTPPIIKPIPINKSLSTSTSISPEPLFKKMRII